MGKVGGPPKIHHGKREVTSEVDRTMRTAFHLWFLLDLPQYADKDDLELFTEPDPVYYARQGMDFANEMNVAKSPHMASREERDAYRPMLREGKDPRDTKTGRCLRNLANSTYCIDNCAKRYMERMHSNFSVLRVASPW